MAGKRYERTFGKELCRHKWEVLSGQWFEFEDSNGRGFCQTDHLVFSHPHVFIVENKLTYRTSGWSQLEDLYLPVVSEVFEAVPICLLVCKNLTLDTPIEDLIGIEEAFQAKRARALVHWIGR